MLPHRPPTDLDPDLDRPPPGPAPVRQRSARRPPALVTHACVVAFALTLLFACSRDEAPDPGPTADQTTRPPTTTTAPTTTTTAKPTPEQEVEAAYLAITASYYEQLTDPDPRAPSISDGFTEPGLSRARARNQELLELGAIDRFSAEGAPVPAIVRLTVDGSTAEVTGCLLDDIQVVELDTGRVLDDDVVSKLLVAQLKRIDGDWKIADQVVVSSWPDRKGCER